LIRERVSCIPSTSAGSKHCSPPIAALISVREIHVDPPDASRLCTTLVPVSVGSSSNAQVILFSLMRNAIALPGS